MMNNDRVKCLYTVCNWVEQLSVFLAQAYSIGSIFPPWDCLEMSLLHSLFLLILWINFSFSKTKMYQDIHTTVISPCIYSIRLKLTMPWMYAIYSNHVMDLRLWSYFEGDCVKQCKSLDFTWATGIAFWTFI